MIFLTLIISGIIGIIIGVHYIMLKWTKYRIVKYNLYKIKEKNGNAIINNFQYGAGDNLDNSIYSFGLERPKT